MKKKILIIEDDQKQADILLALFEEKGYEVVVAMDGNKATEEVNRGVFDAILLDLLLPEMGGLELLRYIGEGSKNKTTPVIVITNSTSKDHMASVLEYGVQKYFIKAETKLEDILLAVEEVVK